MCLQYLPIVQWNLRHCITGLVELAMDCCFKLAETILPLLFKLRLPAGTDIQCAAFPRAKLTGILRKALCSSPSDRRGPSTLLQRSARSVVLRPLHHQHHQSPSFSPPVSLVFIAFHFIPVERKPAPVFVCTLHLLTSLNPNLPLGIPNPTITPPKPQLPSHDVGQRFSRRQPTTG